MVASHYSHYGNFIGLDAKDGRLLWGDYKFIPIKPESKSLVKGEAANRLEGRIRCKIEYLEHTCRLYTTHLGIGGGDIIKLSDEISYLYWYEESYYYTEILRLI